MKGLEALFPDGTPIGVVSADKMASSLKLTVNLGVPQRLALEKPLKQMVINPVGE